MDRFIINGGRKLYGHVEIKAGKNSVLPLISASILSEGKTYIENCPKISDVYVMTEIIKRLGGKAEFLGTTLCVDTENVNSWEIPCDLTREIRASLFMVGALISRFGFASISESGGCNIGDRPIDIHIDALNKLGVIVDKNQNYVFKGQKIKGTEINLRFPSVGATENAIMASIKCEGITVIKNCAREPEICDLQKYLVLLGAKIKGAGSSVITIEGVKNLKRKETVIKPIYDRIEAGTFLIAGAICGGELEFNSESLKNLTALKQIVCNNACKISANNDTIYIKKSNKDIRPLGKISTGPYPLFPTDLQPQIAVLAIKQKGLTVIEDKVFPKRFSYVYELQKTGADIETKDNLCLINGGASLKGAIMSASDLRGGAALVLAGLAIDDVSTVLNVRYIDRGYENFECQLQRLGADVKRIQM